VIGLCFGSFGYFIISYYKLIGWEIEGKEYAAAGGDQAFLGVVVGRGL
jgi:hypothetical protein